MRRLLVLLGLVLALAAPVAAPVAAAERIVDFLSAVTVNADGSLDVRETIAVVAEGAEIRRGILRDFPTRYRDRAGTSVSVGFEVVEVRRDGKPEPWSLESISNGKRIRIGDRDVLLERGTHRYEIAYRTTRQIGLFADHDELYWNVTGNGWTFPIERARAIVSLPEGARIAGHVEFTGPQGSTASHARLVDLSPSRYEAETTRSLGPGEGFTVAVSWQKGIVAPPAGGEELGWWLADNAGYAGIVLTLLLCGAYYLYTWNRVGRDPRSGTIIPIFRPPQGLGPAGARFITTHGLDDRGFAAAMVSLAVKGRLKIADDDEAFSITKMAGAEKSDNPLTSAERALLAALPSGTTVLRQSSHQAIRAARTALERALKAEYEGSVFLRNLKWFWIGLGLSAAGLVLSALLMPGDDGTAGLFAVIWSSIWWGVVLAVAWSAIKGARAQRGILKKLSSLFVLLFLIPFVGGGVAVPASLLWGTGSVGLYLLIGAAVALGLMNLLFFHLLRAPTVPGRKLLDQLDGFRMYLATAEEDRLNVLHPPEKTPELFERYLPYALALDCENAWTAKFAAVLAAAAAAGAAAPAWYSGRHWDAGRTGGFAESLGGSLASSVAAASTAPGRSSGFGGGGSSGGGGGGGGGSGW